MAISAVLNQRLKSWELPPPTRRIRFPVVDHVIGSPFLSPALDEFSVDAVAAVLGAAGASFPSPGSSAVIATVVGASPLLKLSIVSFSTTPRCASGLLKNRSWF